MEDRRNVGENSCNSGDGTDQTGPILDVYDDDDDDDDDDQQMQNCAFFGYNKNNRNACTYIKIYCEYCVKAMIVLFCSSLYTRSTVRL